MDQVLDDIEPLDYEIEELFVTEELSENLREDLPTSSSVDYQNSLIDDISNISSIFLSDQEQENKN